MIPDLSNITDSPNLPSYIKYLALMIKAVYASRTGQLKIIFKNLTLEPTGLRPILL